MASFPGYFTHSMERCEEHGLLIRGTPPTPPPDGFTYGSQRMMSSFALVAESFVTIQSVSSGFARCLCREKSTGSFSWFNKLIKHIIMGSFNKWKMYEKMQYALGRAEDPLDATYLGNARIPMWDRQGPQELCKWQVHNLLQSLILSKYDWEHLTSTTFLIRGRNKSLGENWQQHLNLLSFHYRK